MRVAFVITFTAVGLLEAKDYINVEPEGEDIDAWYDEILSYRDTIILLGYSFETGASLIRTFGIFDGANWVGSCTFRRNICSRYTTRLSMRDWH